MKWILLLVMYVRPGFPAPAPVAVSLSAEFDEARACDDAVKRIIAEVKPLDAKWTCTSKGVFFVK